MARVRLRVKELRERRGLDKRELARLAKVRYATVIEIEKGKTARIDLAVLGELARVLSVESGRYSRGAERSPTVKPAFTARSRSSATGWIRNS